MRPPAAPPPARPPGRDPARQPERTRLSWRRTVLAATIVVLLAVRLALHDQVTPARLLAVAGALLGWLTLLVISWRRITTLATTRPTPPRWSPPTTTLVALGWAGLGVALLLASG